jgi:hypothetical protein
MIDKENIGQISFEVRWGYDTYSGAVHFSRESSSNPYISHFSYHYNGVLYERDDFEKRIRPGLLKKIIKIV